MISTQSRQLMAAGIASVVLASGIVAGAGAVTDQAHAVQVSPMRPQPLPRWLQWQHVPARVARDLHISRRSVEILSPDTAVIITPRGRVITS